VRAEPDWLLDALAHRGPPASGFAARVRAWSAMLRGRHGTTTRRAGPARSNDGTCVRPCWPRAHRGRQPCVLIWRTAAAGARQKSRALRASGGMADAHGSGPCVRKDVGVQLPPCPLIEPCYFGYVSALGNSCSAECPTRAFKRPLPAPPTGRGGGLPRGRRIAARALARDQATKPPTSALAPTRTAVLRQARGGPAPASGDDRPLRRRLRHRRYGAQPVSPSRVHRYEPVA
jgi:hypothetical protein